MSVVHLAKDPMELLKNIDEKAAKMLKELSERYPEILFLKEKDELQKVRIYVITETSSYTS